MKDTKPNALLFMGVITCPVCGTTFHRTRHCAGCYGTHSKTDCKHCELSTEMKLYDVCYKCGYEKEVTNEQH